MPTRTVDGTNDDSGDTPAVDVVGHEGGPDNDGGLLVARGSETMLLDRCCREDLFLRDRPVITAFVVVAADEIFPPDCALAEVLRRCRGRNNIADEMGDEDDDCDDAFPLVPVVVALVVVVVVVLGVAV